MLPARMRIGAKALPQVEAARVVATCSGACPVDPSARSGVDVHWSDALLDARSATTSGAAQRRQCRASPPIIGDHDNPKALASGRSRVRQRGAAVVMCRGLALERAPRSRASHPES